MSNRLLKPRVSELSRYRDDPEAIAEYLAEAFETKDLTVIILAIKTVMRAQNVVQLAAATGLGREHLYRTFRGNVNPRFGRVMELFAGLGIELTVKTASPSLKPDRTGGSPSSSKKKATVRRVKA